MNSHELGPAERCGANQGNCVCGLLYLRKHDGILCGATVYSEACEVLGHEDMAFRKDYVPKVAERIEAAWNAFDGIPTEEIGWFREENKSLRLENERLRRLLEKYGELGPDGVPLVCKQVVVLRTKADEQQAILRTVYYSFLDDQDVPGPELMNLVGAAIGAFDQKGERSEP